MKTDTQIRQDILDELKWDPSINEKAIGVSVKDGVVTLAGTVETYAQKFNAERAVERVVGVRAVADSLNVAVPTMFGRTDTDIASAAVSALDWDIEVPAGVKVKVVDGWLTLEGKVQWQFQKAAAERAVRNLTGVRGVTNLMAFNTTKASATEVSGKIRDALQRSAEYDAKHITVETHEGKVTLHGTVRSFAEREDAERAAWAAPGVSAVDDHIIVGV